MYLFWTVYCLDLRHVKMSDHTSHVFLYCNYLLCYAFGGKTLQSEAEKSFILKTFSPLFTPTQEADVVKVYQLTIPQLLFKLLITSWINYFQKETLLGSDTASYCIMGKRVNAVKICPYSVKSVVKALCFKWKYLYYMSYSKLRCGHSKGLIFILCFDTIEVVKIKFFCS